MAGRVARILGAVAEALRHEHFECGTPQYVESDELPPHVVYRKPVCHCGALMAITVVPRTDDMTVVLDDTEYIG